MFGSVFRDMDEDPFFSNHRNTMQHMMDSMNSMNSMMMPMPMGFPTMMLPGLEPPHMRHRPRERSMMPFDFPGFPQVAPMFSNFEQIPNNPNCHTFSSSSVMTYTTGQDGAPQMYQASVSSRTGPGGIRETRKTELDSTRGVQKMAIGRHIGERAHVIERVQNKVTGDEDENQEYVNLDEEEADGFNAEWSQRLGREPNSHRAVNGQRQLPQEQQLAITNGENGSRSRKRETEDEEVVHGKSRRHENRRDYSGRPRHETDM